MLPLFVGFLLLLPIAGTPGINRSGEEVQAKQAQKTTLKGILDEEGSARYVLRREGDLQIQAVLEAKGFSPDNFARFVGERVVVRGELVQGKTPPVMKVESIRNQSADESQ